jgi:hypothetical protein
MHMTNLRPKAGMALGSGREPGQDELRVLLQPETEPPQDKKVVTKRPAHNPSPRIISAKVYAQLRVIVWPGWQYVLRCV